tara:strand:- start:1330 stop:2724 length:1395 start_codon:yes stop_codon:yes gene_type:complete
MIRTTLFGIFLILGTMMLAVAKEETPTPLKRAAIITIDGAIGPATLEYVKRALEIVRTKHHNLAILKINTPGGLVDSTRKINTIILNAPVPIVGYVAPSGAHAASAGTYILYATHIAAMAPGTNLGAATPVQIGGPDTQSNRPKVGKPQKKELEQKRTSNGISGSPKSPMQTKTINDLSAYIKSLAELHGRNSEWAEKAVIEAATLTARGALKNNVINVIAKDVNELLAKLHGRSVELSNSSVTLDTKNMVIDKIDPDWQVQLLSVATNPNVAFVMMLIGIYGIIFEFWHPGLIGPGVIGGICLLIGLYATNMLPLNYTGAGLLILGMAFMTAEAFLPSFGILGIGGIISFIFGSTLLFDSDSPEFQLSWIIIISSALFCSALLSFILSYVWRSFKRPVVSGTETLIGTIAEVLEWSDDKGSVRAEGERWKAFGMRGVKKGQKVKIVQLVGLSVMVSQLDSKES